MLRLVMLFSFLIYFNSNSQASWDNTDFISEDSYCFKLLPRESERAFDLESELKRYNEESVDKLTQEGVFRIVIISGPPGDEQQISIIRFQRFDSLCSITFKTLDNPKRKTVFVYTKSYGLKTWDKFMALADTTFWNQPEKTPYSGAILDGQSAFYEFKFEGKYHKIIRGSNFQKSKEKILSERLWKLLEPIFGVNCKK